MREYENQSLDKGERNKYTDFIERSMKTRASGFLIRTQLLSPFVKKPLQANRKIDDMVRSFVHYLYNEEQIHVWCE